MAKKKAARARTGAKPATGKKPSASRVEYLLGKGTSRFFSARIDREEIHLIVNGPAMLYSKCRLLASLDMQQGATFQAWTQLAAALKCTSYCGRNGTNSIPVEVEASRIGSCLVFSVGPMSMYQTLVVLRPKKKGQSMRAVIDKAFENPSKPYSVLIVPEAATTHEEHDATIFDPSPPVGGNGGHGGHDHDHGGGHSHP